MAFSKNSKTKLDQCDDRLRKVFTRVDSLGFECTIVTGHRGEAEQTEHYEAGRSKVPFPNSKHNVEPSLATDAAPYDTVEKRIPEAALPAFYKKLSAKDKEAFQVYVKEMGQFYFFAGAVQAVANSINVPLRWGGDWDGDGNFEDQTFDDLWHFELIED